MIVLAFLRWPANAGKELFLWVLFAALVTNPPAQCAALSLGDEVLLGTQSRVWSCLAAIELAVVIVEYALMWWILRRLHRQGVIETTVSGKRTLVVVFVANAASFLGAIFLFPIPLGLMWWIVEGVW
ncbi:MAG: hypothetical protein AB1646_22035 [Thermodesulfobacteriota bacterium]